MGKLEFNQEVRLHNKFHVVVKDVRTGEMTQEAWAYNLILDQAFNKIIDAFGKYMSYGSSLTSYHRIMRPNSNIDIGKEWRYGGYIQLGTGTGILSGSRTKLFDFYKGFYGSYYDSGWDVATMKGFYTLHLVIPQGEPYPGPITEIGLASYSSEAWLSTHALLEDSEGGQIHLSPGPYDQLHIYATTFFEATNALANVGFVGGANNFFKKLFIDNDQPPWSSNNRYRLLLGKNSSPINSQDDPVLESTGVASFYYNSNGVSYNKSTKKIVFTNIRVAPEIGNSNKGIREIGFAVFDDASNTTYPVFRTILPLPGVWPGKDIEDEEVDTGDGQTTVFNLKWPDIVYESEEIYVQGRSPELQVRGTDYTMSDPETSEITFAVAPASGAAITANYAVEYIPKDENHVLDISFTFSFKDANAE